MIRWQVLIPSLLIGMGLMAGSLVVQPAHSEEGGRKLLHLFSSDFPPNAAMQYPAVPVQETRFWQLMDREIKATDDLTLTENMENADYRVELRCSGILHCSKLNVDIKDAKRNVLGSFTIRKIAPYWGYGPVNLEKVAHELTQRLDERLHLLDQGGYGAME